MYVLQMSAHKIMINMAALNQRFFLFGQVFSVASLMYAEQKRFFAEKNTWLNTTLLLYSRTYQEGQTVHNPKLSNYSFKKF